MFQKIYTGLLKTFLTYLEKSQKKGMKIAHLIFIIIGWEGVELTER